MPSFPIVDAHVHLWDPVKYRIPWLDRVPPINTLADLAMYDEATAGLDVEAIVYLQVEVAEVYSLTEARDIAALADPRIQGIVAWAPLEYGEQARYYLEELVKISPKIKGVRRIAQDDPDPHYYSQSHMVAGQRLLSEFGLSSDLTCRADQLVGAIELVRQVPETNFILDHHGNPKVKDHAWEPWASNIRELASLPNVVSKISGIVSNADAEHWTLDDIKPYVRHCLESFGEDRVIFGSDWRVVTLAASYARWVESLDAITADFSADAKRKLWNANAKRFYRL